VGAWLAKITNKSRSEIRKVASPVLALATSPTFLRPPEGMAKWGKSPYLSIGLLGHDVSPAVNGVPLELFRGQREAVTLTEIFPGSVHCRDGGASVIDGFRVLKGHLVVGGHKNPFVISFGESAKKGIIQ
jgi:hypothetical protein